MPTADEAALEAGLALADRKLVRVLDVGGGTGRAARAVGDATVVDPAAGMLREARRAGTAGVRGDAGTLPFRDGSVDAVVIVDALHHFPSANTAIAEAARVLAPGGVLVVREFDPTTVRGRLLVAAEHLVGFGSEFYSPNELAKTVERAGLAASFLDRGFGYTVVGAKRGD